MVYGPLMIIGVLGKTLTDDEKKFIINNQIGGVILFSRNYESPKQLHELCHSISSLRHKMPDKTPLFISVDMEGGRVQRFKQPFTVWPPLSHLGKIDNPTISFSMSQKMGQELKSFGINLNFAPCADVLSNPTNTAIGDRSIGSDPELVGKHVSALVRGYLKSDVVGCVKHFPGHGNTILDSHEDLPIEDMSLEDLEKISIIPFRRAFKARVDMCMTSHIKFPKIDDKYPASLSPVIIKKLLKDSCRFKGLIISDDLDMKALTKNFSTEDIPVKALVAGTDILLYCNEPLSPPRALESIQKALDEDVLGKSELEARIKKINQFKKEMILNPDPLSFEESMAILESQDSKELAASIKSLSIPEKFLTMKS